MAGHAQAASGSELGLFLRARRSQITPTEVGLTEGPGIRRTEGLRREEVAALSGISIDYYTRLERGKETNPSPSVVDSLARALHLDQSEQDYLQTLAAKAAGRARTARPTPPRHVDPSVKLLLESLRPNPAHVVGRTGDILAANPGGLRLLAGIEKSPAAQRNVWRFVFLDPTARELFPDWKGQMRSGIASLRALAGIEPDAKDLRELVDELLVKSPEFAKMWAQYDVRGHDRGRKTIHHPEIGSLTLSYQTLRIADAPGQAIVAYVAAPDTPEYDALVLLDRIALDEAAHSRSTRE